MKTLQKIALFIALIALFASCQSKTDVPKILANQDTKKEVMQAIAADSVLANEMMQTMMNSENSKMILMEFHGSMMEMMKEDPAMMRSMMNEMMETCKNDTAMMSSMYKNMMENPEMMMLMHKMMGAKMDMKKMDGMDHQMK